MTPPALKVAAAVLDGASGAGLGPAGAGWVTIARHGRPALNRDTLLTREEFRDWWRAYDAGGLAPQQTPPSALVKAAAEADVIFASTLARSIETARAVAAGKPIIENALFVEAPLPPPPMLGKRSPDAWGVWARCAWWAGLSDGQESRAQAELRAAEAASVLIERAEAGANVLLLAHGWFNRMMRPVFLARGWRCAVDGGDSYWSHRRYERR